MDKIFSDIIGQAAGGAVGMGMGLLLEGHNDRRQLEQQRKLQELQMAGSKEMAEFSRQQQMKMWEDTNYKAQMEQLKKAGLNPGLIYGMSGGGGATTAAAQATGPQGAHAPTGGGESMALMMQGAERQMQLKLLEAQKENIEADTANKQATATKTSGVDTDLTKAQAENTVLQQIITKYTGQEQKQVFEQVTQPNREIQAQAYQNELEARTGIAGTIYELWTEGKLKDKSVAEIEQLLLHNDKTKAETRTIIKSMDLLEENIKGAKLDNIIRDLETRLQSETGIDKASPAWMKVLGRLFVNLINR